MSLTKQDLSDIRDVILDALDVAVNPRLDSLEEGVDNLGERMDGVEHRLGGVEKRLDGVEQRLDGVEHRLDGVEHRLSGVEHRLSGVEQRLDGVEQQQRVTNAMIQNIDGRLSALENDIKDIYLMLSDLQKQKPANKKLAKLSLEDKLLRAHADLLAVAKEAGVTLPSQTSV